MNKILSIIVPSYNMEGYLPKCLDSLIIDDKGLLQRVEVIVVNDGSKDHTSEIAHDFKAKYSDVFKVIDKENGNYGSCINAGLKIATGAFIKVLDADDSYDKKEFSKLIAALISSEQGNENVDLYLTDYVIVGENERFIFRRSYDLPAERIIDVAALERLPLLYMHAVAYRTKNLIDIGYKQTEGVSYTDNEWVCYPIQTVRRVRYAPIPVYKYLVGREGQTVDPKVRRKAIWALAEIALRMDKELADKALGRNDVWWRYIAEFILMINTIVYETTILELHNDIDDKRLIAFDRLVYCASKSTYTKVMERLVSKKIGFAYGRHWRSKGTSRSVKLIGYRVYLGAVRRIGSVVRWLGGNSK